MHYACSKDPFRSIFLQNSEKIKRWYELFSSSLLLIYMAHVEIHRWTFQWNGVKYTSSQTNVTLFSWSLPINYSLCTFQRSQTLFYWRLQWGVWILMRISWLNKNSHTCNILFVLLRDKKQSETQNRLLHYEPWLWILTLSLLYFCSLPVYKQVQFSPY